MDLPQIRQRLDLERRTGALGGGDVKVEVMPVVTRVRSADGAWYTVVFSSLSDQNADEAIAEQAEYFRGQGGEVEWKVYAHDEPSDIRQRLERYGFEVGPCEAVLVLDLQSPSWIFDAPSHRVVRVEDLDQVQVFRDVAEGVFGGDLSSMANDLARAIRSGSRDHVGYIAYDGDTPAAVGRLYTGGKSEFGGLYGGGTLTAHRGRGLYRALVAARARDAAELGARHLLVDALPTSRPILESLGFVHLTDTWPCTLQSTM